VVGCGEFLVIPRFASVCVPDSSGLGGLKGGFFVAKTWTNRGCSVVVVVLLLVVFGSSFGWSAGRRFRRQSRSHRAEKQADLWQSFGSSRPQTFDSKKKNV
jgi:hypothetical protein